MTPPDLAIVASIGDRPISRSAVLDWEDRRIDAAARKLGVAAPPPAPIAERREVWLQVKRALGDEEILLRLRTDITVAGAAARVQTALTRRRRRCVTDLHVPGASAQQFTEWFEHITATSDRDEMERACPDHFVLRFDDGAQDVVETNGGSPFTARFAIDYDDVSSLATPIDPDFPFRLDGVARSPQGAAVGGVRHQFRDVDGGVHARLVVEFPALMVPTVVRGHRWHLACEFSNWFEAARIASAS